MKISFYRFLENFRDFNCYRLTRIVFRSVKNIVFARRFFDAIHANPSETRPAQTVRTRIRTVGRILYYVVTHSFETIPTSIIITMLSENVSKTHFHRRSRVFFSSDIFNAVLNAKTQNVYFNRLRFQTSSVIFFSSRRPPDERVNPKACTVLNACTIGRVRRQFIRDKTRPQIERFSRTSARFDRKHTVFYSRTIRVFRTVYRGFFDDTAVRARFEISRRIRTSDVRVISKWTWIHARAYV